jgi:hypothetical protein
MRYHFLRFAMFLLWVPAVAFGQSHFGPGVANIRDYAVPEPGVYAAVYNYGYIMSDLTDNSGNSVRQILVGNTPVNVYLDVKMYALAPMLLWVPRWNFLGGHYSAYISPTFSNANIVAALSSVNGAGINTETSQFYGTGCWAEGPRRAAAFCQ